MGTVLLVISTTRESPRTVAYALRRVKELRGRLVALSVIDTSLADSIVQKLADTGVVGDKPGEEIFGKILEEYRQRGVRKLSEIAEAGKKEGITVKTVLREGDLADECLKSIEEEKATVVIVGRKRISKLSQFIFGSPIRMIEKNAPCPVEVVEEGS